MIISEITADPHITSHLSLANCVVVKQGKEGCGTREILLTDCVSWHAINVKTMCCINHLTHTHIDPEFGVSLLESHYYI